MSQGKLRFQQKFWKRYGILELEVGWLEVDHFCLGYLIKIANCALFYLILHIDDKLDLANVGVLVRKIRNTVKETSVKSQRILLCYCFVDLTFLFIIFNIIT